MVSKVTSYFQALSSSGIQKIFSKKVHYSRVTSRQTWVATKMSIKLGNNKYVLVTNKLSKWTHTKHGQYTPVSIKNKHILPFIRVTHLVVSLDEEILVLLVLIGVRGLVHQS